MPELEQGKFKIGDLVTLKTQAGRVGKIVACQGSFGTQRDRIYRVLVHRKPRPAYVEVLESQMDKAPASPAGAR